MEWTQDSLNQEIEKSVKRAEKILDNFHTPETVGGYARMALANIEFTKLLIAIRENQRFLLKRPGLKRPDLLRGEI